MRELFPSFYSRSLVYFCQTSGVTLSSVPQSKKWADYGLILNDFSDVIKFSVTLIGRGAVRKSISNCGTVL